MDAESLNDFHADLRAIDRFQGGVDWGQTSSGANTSLESCIEIVSQRAASGSLLVDWAESTDQLPDRYRAALVIYLQTGQIDLVRNGLLPVSRSASPLGRLGHWVYLLLLLLLAYLGLVLFTFFTAPRIDAIRIDLTLQPISILEAPRSLQSVLQTLVLILPALAAVAMLGGLVWRRARNSLQNDDGIVSDRLNWVEQLHVAGMAPDAALRFGLDLVRLVPSRRQNIVARLQPSTGGSLSPRWIAESLRLSILRRHRWMRLVLPTFLLLFVGGGVALGYGLLVFWPLASLLFDMSRVRV